MRRSKFSKLISLALSLLMVLTFFPAQAFAKGNNSAENTVVFKDYDGTVLSTQQVVDGEDAVAPDHPTREGYTENGWDTDYTGVTEDLVVTALYLPIEEEEPLLLSTLSVDDNTVNIYIYAGNSTSDPLMQHKVMYPVTDAKIAVYDTTEGIDLLHMLQIDTGYTLAGASGLLPASDIFKNGQIDLLDGPSVYNVYVFVQTKQTTSYTVHYWDAANNPLIPDKVVSDITVGTPVTEHAATITGYTVTSDDPKTLVLAYSGNVITFKYAPTVYPITYVLGGGTNNPLNFSSYTMFSPPIMILDPTWAGHIFLGWSEGNSIPTGSTGEKTFTAIWKEKTALTLTANSATVSYNGTEQSVSGFTGSISGLTYENLTAGASGTASGEYTANFANQSSLVIRDNGIDVTDQYNVSYVTGKLTINKVTLTATAVDRSMTYGNTATLSPAEAVTYTGFVNGENATSAGITGSVSYSYDNGTTSVTVDNTLPAGAYFIRPDVSGLFAANYTIIGAHGTLTVSQATMTLNVIGYSGFYDSTIHYVNAMPSITEGTTLYYSTTGGTNLSAYSTTNPGIKNVSDSKTIYVAAVNPNYQTVFKSAAITLLKRTVTLTSGSASRAYDGTALTSTEVTLGGNGFVTGEGFVSVPVASGTITNAGSTANIIVIPDLNANTLAENYTISKTEGTLTINKATLTATAVNRSMTYGDTTTLTPAEAVVYSGFVNGEDATSAGITGSLSYTYYYKATVVTVDNTLAVGSYYIRPNVTGLSAENYLILGALGTLTVSKATMTLDVTGYTGLYDGTTRYVDATPSITEGTTLYYSTTGGTDLNAYSTTNPGVKNVSESKTIYVAAVNPNYETKFGSAAITLTKRTVTLTSGDASRDYNGTALTSTAVTLGGNGFVTGEGFVSAPVASGTITGAGSTANTIVIPDLDANTLAENYTISKTEGTLTIYKVALTATAVNRSMTYGDTTTLSPAEAVTYTGFVNGEDATSAGISGSVSYTYYSGATVVTVDNTLASGSYAIRPNVSGLSAANYTISGADGTLTVSKATMTLDVTGYNGLYDGTIHYAAATPGAAAGTTLYYSTTGGTNLSAYSTTNPGVLNVADSKTIYVAAVNPNYETAFGSAALTITKRSIVLTSASASKMYDGTALTSPNVTISGDGFVGSQGFMWTPTATGVIVNVGSRTNTINQPWLKTNTNGGNYVITKSEGTLTITKSNLLSVTASSYNAKYDGLPHGLLPIPSVSILSGTVIYYSYTGGAYPGDYTLVPPYAWNVSDSKTVFIAAVNSNYETAYCTASLTITKRTVTLTSGDASKTYDGTPLTKAGVTIGGDGFVLLQGFAGTPTASGTITNVGSTANTIVVPPLRTSTLGNTLAENYDIVKNEGTLTVTQASLTATAVNRSMTYGDVSSLTPAEDVSYSGFVNGEDATSAGISGSVTYKYYDGATEVTVDGTLPAGTYAIRPDVSGLSAVNYAITGADGTLTVNKAALTATAVNRSMTYGDMASLTPAEDVTYTGFVNSEDAASAGVSGSLTYKYYNGATEVMLDGTLPAGTYAIRPDVSGLSAANYTFAGADGTLTVNKAVLTATAANRSMIYGDTTTLDPADNSVSYTGFANGEDSVSAGISGSVTYKYYDGALETTVDNSLVAGAYAIRPDVTGLSAVNYTFAGADGTLTVNKRPILIRALDSVKNFGDVDPAFTYEIPTGLIGTTTYYGIRTGDETQITIHAFRFGTEEAVGTYADVIRAGYLADVSFVQNYDIHTETADFTINPRVTYDVNTVDAVTGMPATAWYAYLGSAIISNAVNVVRTGYTLTGWLDKDTGDAVALGAVISPINRNYNLAAVWQPVVYAITYTLNGGTNAAANPATYTIASATITLAAPTRLGYTFTGWTPTNTIPNGSTGNRAFTATWSDPIEYDITYLMNGGTNAAANPTTYTVESGTITLDDPTRTGYDFLGWTPTDTIPAGSTGDRTFTAAWSDPLEYTVTYYVTGGTDSGLDGATPYAVYTGVAYGSAIPVPGDPSQTDYTFDGWTTAIPTTMPAGNLSIYGSMTYVKRAIETIPEAPVPLAAPSWALLNLILAVITAIASGIMLAGLLKKRDETSGVSSKSKVVRFLTLLPVIGAAVAFILTENLANTMVFTDRWTLLMGGILLVQAILMALGMRSSKE